MKLITCILILTMSLLSLGCSSEEQAEKPADQATEIQHDKNDGVVTIDLSKGMTDDSVKIDYKMSNIPFSLTGEPVSIAGVTFTPAIEWTVLAPEGMKKASFIYGPLADETDSASLNVFYFGKNSGGSVEDNIERWINQISLDSGQDPHTAAIQYEMDVDGMKTHVLSLAGVYHAPIGGPMSRVKLEKEDYRLIGIVVEAHEGNIFFKLTGPEYTSRIMTEAFFTMIKTKLKKN